ncbi:unnamed protein product [Phyllotreta striolata]|uniref:Uncharacterized protein n=1 Tax=Phyllotreta striolata TaxID=444603 RepID=A0A9N9XS58_PHYSR|nr:unnamed protein product [Phyllotreta striolata]
MTNKYINDNDNILESTSKTRTCDCINCLGKSTLEDIDVLLKRLDIIRKCCPIFEQCNSIKRNPLTRDRSRSRIPLAIHRLKKDTNLCSLSYVEPTKSHSADSIDDASASFYRNKSLERTSIIKQDAQKGAKSGKKVTFSELNTANRPKLHIDLCDLQRAGDEDDVDGHLDEDRRILEDKIHQINNLRREWLLRNSSGVIDGYKDTSRTYRIW